MPDSRLFPGSSNIDRATYDADTGTLEVTFARGHSYTYQGVTQDTWQAWNNAPSAGAFFHENIKGLGE